MDPTAYQHWWRLHLRVARGEPLSSDERAVYAAGRRQIEQEEQLRETTEARQLRESLRELENTHKELELERQQLDNEIRDLESQLSEQTRPYLGVED